MYKYDYEINWKEIIMSEKCRDFNGHYKDSNLPQSERDRLDIEAQKENENLTSWDDVPETFEFSECFICDGRSML